MLTKNFEYIYIDAVENVLNVKLWSIQGVFDNFVALVSYALMYDLKIS